MVNIKFWTMLSLGLLFFSGTSAQIDFKRLERYVIVYEDDINVLDSTESTINQTFFKFYSNDTQDQVFMAKVCPKTFHQTFGPVINPYNYTDFENGDLVESVQLDWIYTDTQNGNMGQTKVIFSKYYVDDSIYFKLYTHWDDIIENYYCGFMFIDPIGFDVKEDKP